MSSKVAVHNHGLVADMPSQELVDDLILRLTQATELISQPKPSHITTHTTTPPPDDLSILVNTHLAANTQPSHLQLNQWPTHSPPTSMHSKSETKEQFQSDKTTDLSTAPVINYNPLRSQTSPETAAAVIGQQFPSANPEQAKPTGKSNEQSLLLPPSGSLVKSVSGPNAQLSTPSALNFNQSSQAKIGFSGRNGDGSPPHDPDGYAYVVDDAYQTEGFRCGLFPRKFKRAFIAPIICVILMVVAGIVAAIELYRKLHHDEFTRWQENNQHACDSRAKLFQQNLGFAIAACESMAGFFSVQHRFQHDYGFVLSNDDWLLYLQQSSAPQFIDQFVWLALVLDRDRATFENVTGHNITDIDVTTTPYNYQHRRAQYPYYLPYQYHYPNFSPLPPGIDDLYNIDGNFVVPADGIDSDLLAKTLAWGKLRFSNRQELEASIHDPTIHQQWGAVLALPVYYPGKFINATGNLTVDLENNLPNAIGIVGVVVRVSIALELAVEAEPDIVPFQITLYDTSTKDGHTYLTEVWPDGVTSSDDLDLGQNATVLFQIGERGYELDCVPTKDYVQVAYSSTPLLVGVGAGIVVGVCIMILLCGYLILNVRRSNQRTVMLAEANTSKNISLSLLAQAKELADRANKSKSDFLAFLCHELRNPLHAISAMVEFLHQDYFATQADKDVAGNRDNGTGENGSDRSSEEHRERNKDKRREVHPVPVLVTTPLYTSNGSVHSVSKHLIHNNLSGDHPSNPTESLTPTNSNSNSSRRHHSRKDRSKAEAADCVGVIRSQVELMRTIIDDCLDMSKIEAGVIQFESIGIELGVLARQCVQSLNSKCKEKGIRLRLHIDHTHLPRKVYADPTRLKQLIMNLLTNAIKFTNKGAVQLLLSATPWTIESALAAELELNPEEQQHLLQKSSLAFQTPNVEPGEKVSLPPEIATTASAAASDTTTLAESTYTSGISGNPLAFPPSTRPNPLTMETAHPPSTLSDVGIEIGNFNPPVLPSSYSISKAINKQHSTESTTVTTQATDVANDHATIPQPPSLHLQRPNSIILQISVVDSGSGIQPSALPHLFQPYSQEKLSIMRTHGGTGLGLAIVKNIVSHMHGSIQVQSELGKGSKFTLYLPLSSRSSNAVGLDVTSSKSKDDASVNETENPKHEKHRKRRPPQGHRPDLSGDENEEEDAIESQLLDKFDRSDFDHGMHSSDSDSTNGPASEKLSDIKHHPPSFFLPTSPHEHTPTVHSQLNHGTGRISLRIDASHPLPSSPKVHDQLHPDSLESNHSNRTSRSSSIHAQVTFHEENSSLNTSRSSKTKFTNHTTYQSGQHQILMIDSISNEGQPEEEKAPTVQAHSTSLATETSKTTTQPLNGNTLISQSESPPATSSSATIAKPIPPSTPLVISSTSPTTILHLLLVDDADINLKILCKMLGNSILVNGTYYKLVLTLASDGAEAMVKIEERFIANSKAESTIPPSYTSTQQWSAHPFPIIASDIVMPLMDGFMFARSLRAFESRHDLAPAHLIALTANALKADVDKYESASFKYFIPKPFCKKDLITALQKVITTYINETNPTIKTEKVGLAQS